MMKGRGGRVGRGRTGREGQTDKRCHLLSVEPPGVLNWDGFSSAGSQSSGSCPLCSSGLGEPPAAPSRWKREHDWECSAWGKLLVPRGCRKSPGDGGERVPRGIP